jgi:amidase
VRIAWSRDLGGLPVDPRVTGVLESRRGVFADLGCEVVAADPGWEGADEAFKTLRAWTFSQGFSVLPEAALAAVKDTVRWNVEQGRALTGDDVGRAEVLRTQLYQRVREFMREHEFLLLPVNQVPPFDVEEPYPEEIAGVRMQTYIDWMKSAYYVTLTGHPAISVPCGFTPDGLPVGIQIVGRQRDDFGVLQLAYAFEQATELWRRRPEERGRC